VKNVQNTNLYGKKKKKLGCQWLMPVILAEFKPQCCAPYFSRLLVALEGRSNASHQQLAVLLLEYLNGQGVEVIQRAYNSFLY
jgi:hypothetical protein